MANEILKFKKGLHVNLPAELSNGSFYVTTDERALYVDLVAPVKDADGKPTSTTELQRIRLSDIIQYNSYADFRNDAPPYSTTAIYYIVDENALLKYKFDSETNTYVWQQINSVSDVTADLDALTSRVTANETSIGNNATAIKKLNKDVYGNEDGSQHDSDGLIKAVAALEAADEEIKADVKTNADNITAINGEISDIKEDITGIDTRVTTLETDLSEVSGRVTELETWKNTADTDITNLKNSVGVNTSDPNGGSGTVYERLADLRTQISNNDADILALQNKDTAIETRVTKNEQSISGINGSITTINENISGLDGRLTTAEGDIDNLESRMGTAEGQITSLDTTVKGHTATLATHDSSIGANTAAITNLTNTVGDASKGLVQKVNTNSTNIQTNTDAIEDINDTIGTAGAGQTGTLYELIAANKTASDTNASNHTTLKGRVDTIEGTVTNHGTDISDLQTWQTTAQGQITALQNKDSAIDGEISSIKGVNATQTQNIQKNADDISALTGRVAANEASITSLGNTKLDKSTYEEGIADLEDTLNSKILAANAMRYVGTTADDTPDYYTGETGYRIGDTWVASAKITGTAFTANPGDLIIAHSADGTEDADGYITTGNITWQVVDTGYNDSHKDSLIGTDNKISLTSYAGDDLGTVTFEGQGAAKVSISANKVVVSTEWEDF